MPSDSTRRRWARPWGVGAPRRQDAAGLAEPDLTRDEVVPASEAQPSATVQGGDWDRRRLVKACWPFAFLLALHVVVFGVPALAGYPVWSSVERSVPLLSLPQTIDTTTFPTLERQVRAWI